MTSIPFEIKRKRRYVRATIKPRIGILGKADGTLYCEDDTRYWCRWIGSADSNGNASTGTAFRVFPGDTNYLPEAGRQVYIGPGRNSKLTVLGAVPEDLINAGHDARAFNPNDPYRHFVYTNNIVTFRSDALADEGNDTFEVNLNQLLYLDAYGSWKLWNGTNEDSHLDYEAFKTALADDEHCLAIAALRTLENDWQTFASTPKSNFTDFTIADLQEVADKLDAECLHSRVYRIAWDMDTLIADPVTDWDLRQWINVPARLGNPNVITRKERVRAGHQLLYHGELGITTGDLEILGDVGIIDDAEAGTGGGGMTSFDVSADTGTPATIANGDELEIVGDGTTTETSIAAKVVTIATKPKAIPKLCGLRMAVDAGSPDDVIAAFTNATVLNFLPFFYGGTFSLPVSGVWNYFDIGDIDGTIDYAKTGLTGNVTNASAIITNIPNTEQLAVGMKVAGTGINAAATIGSIDSATQITMSHTASATNTGVALTFTFPADTNYDVFLKYSSVEGAVIPVYEKWSTNTARVVMPLPLYDYVVVSDNSDNLRFMGTIRAGSSGFSKNDVDCHVSNWNNPYPHKMLYQDTTAPYGYTTTTWRQWRNQSAARFGVVVQLYALMDFEFTIGTSTTTNQPLAGIGVDSTSLPDSQAKGGYGSQTSTRGDARSTLTTTRAQGFHTIYPLERGATGASFHGSVSFNGTDIDVRAGFSGKVWS
jgi:hypothetical protein